MRHGFVLARAAHMRTNNNQTLQGMNIDDNTKGIVCKGYRDVCFQNIYSLLHSIPAATICTALLASCSQNLQDSPSTQTANHTCCSETEKNAVELDTLVVAGVAVMSWYKSAV